MHMQYECSQKKGKQKEKKPKNKKKEVLKLNYLNLKSWYGNEWDKTTSSDIFTFISAPSMKIGVQNGLMKFNRKQNGNNL